MDTKERPEEIGVAVTGDVEVEGGGWLGYAGSLILVVIGLALLIALIAFVVMASTPRGVGH